MRKIIYLGTVTLIVGAIVSACKKEVGKPEFTEDQKTEFASKEIKVSAEHNYLVFETVEDFNTINENPTEQTKQQFLNQVKNLKYTSWNEKAFRSKSDDDSLTMSDTLFNDPYLTSILNEDWTVQIGNFLYRINPINRTVFVLPSIFSTEYTDLRDERTSNQHIRTFSTEDDVLSVTEHPAFLKGIMKGDHSDVIIRALSKNCQSSNQEVTDGGWLQYIVFLDLNNVYGNGDDKVYKFNRKLKVRYDNWGITRRLFTEFEHKETNGGTFNGTYFSIGYSFIYIVKNGDYGSSSYYPYSFLANGTLEYTGTALYEFFDSHKAIDHYRGSKCLRSYDLQSFCNFRNRGTFKPNIAGPIHISGS